MRTKTLALFATAALAASTAVAADLPAQAPGATDARHVQKAELLAARQSWDARHRGVPEAIAASPKDAALRNRLGICYQRKGDDKAARAAYKKALDLRKDYAEAWNNLGTLDHARGKYKPADLGLRQGDPAQAAGRGLPQEPGRGVARPRRRREGARGLDRGLPPRPRGFEGDAIKVPARRRHPRAAVLPLREAARRARRDREGARVPGEGARGGLQRLREGREATATSRPWSWTRATRR